MKESTGRGRGRPVGSTKKKAAEAREAKAAKEKKKIPVKDDAKVAKRKKMEKKASKDPNFPKRPSTAFFVFLEDFRQKYKQDHPDVKGVAAVGKAAGDKWGKMTDDEKAVYVNKAAQRRAEYAKAMAEFEKKQEDEDGSAEDSKENEEESAENEEEEEDDD